MFRRSDDNVLSASPRIPGWDQSAQDCVSVFHLHGCGPMIYSRILGFLSDQTAMTENSAAKIARHFKLRPDVFGIEQATDRYPK
jgi:hypothetical protein